MVRRAFSKRATATQYETKRSFQTKATNLRRRPTG